MLSQLRRKCKGNNAGYIPNVGSVQSRKSAVLSEILHLFILTTDSQKVIRERTLFLARESVMSDEKLVALRQA